MRFIRNKWNSFLLLTNRMPCPINPLLAHYCKYTLCLILQTYGYLFKLIFGAKSSACHMLLIKLKLFWTSRIALSSFVFWSLEETLFPWCCEGCWAAADERKAALHNWPVVCVWRRNSVVFMWPEALSRFSRRRKGEVHPSKLLWYCTEKALTVASPIGTLAYCVPPHVAR